MLAGELNSARTEVSHFQKVAEDLGVQQTQLEDVVSSIKERNACLETQLLNTECAAENLKTDHDVAIAKVLELEQVTVALKNQVCFQLLSIFISSSSPVCLLYNDFHYVATTSQYSSRYSYECHPKSKL